MHRFLSPAAAEAFTGTTPEQVRADLAHLDDLGRWPTGERPRWLQRFDVAAGGKLAHPIAVDRAFRFLADQAATAEREG
jgi:hypothetical protein